ncbi:A24 family peptidase [Rhizobium sp. SL86]|uniref:A24 family peptidase n=1 Tax=Rhizobium sp. SL86 TaxID=2995148 RepID=UPI002272E66F|nr:prepilin peptidase [Rhizobium sp. SL86]MCY1665131.1 prepilin peptidase [Rhizobium sp. SL86]
MASFLAVILPAALAIAAATDLLTMKIPNWVSIILVLAFYPVALIAGFDPTQLGIATLAALAVFAGCFALFAMNVMGGGDAKLLTAAALWFGYNASLVSFLVLVSIAGGVLTLLILLLRSQANSIMAIGLPLPHSLVTAKKIPYAIAIAAGGLLAWSEAPLYTLLMRSAA